MPIPLTASYAAARLRAAARASKDAHQTRRLLTLAAIHDGATRTEAAAIGGVTVQIIRDWRDWRDWLVKLNADGPEGLVDRPGDGACRRYLADLGAAHPARRVHPLPQ